MTVTVNVALEDKKMLDRMLRLINPQATYRVLDVGTGPGGNTALALAPFVSEVLTIDVNTDAIARFHQKLDELGDGIKSKIKVEVRSIDWLEELGDATFNIVTCRAAFHHFSEPDRVLTEFYRILEPGGKFEMMDPVFSDHSRDTWVAITKMKESDLHNMYTYQEYVDMVTGAGFEIEAMIPFRFPRVFSQWAATASEAIKDRLKQVILQLPTRMRDELQITEDSSGDLSWSYSCFELMARKPGGAN